MADTPQLFNHIAPLYERWSAILSANGIRYWHQLAVEQLALRPGLTVLDVGCGTGQVTREMARRMGGQGEVTGLDPSTAMLQVARETPVNPDSAPIVWQEGVGEALPFPDRHFDRVTAQFSIRNMHDWRQGLSEMVRVLKPGGRLVILELVQPLSALGALALRGLGAVTHELPDKDLEPFEWLGRSLYHAPTAKELTAYLLTEGLFPQNAHYWLGDLVWVGVFDKPAGIGVAPVAQESPPKLVWATDGSLTALAGARWISRMIRPGALVHVLTVIPEGLPDGPVGLTEREAWIRHAETSQKALDPERYHVIPVLREGPPAPTIVDYVRQICPDLLVLGFKGRSESAERLFGGVSRYVWNHTTCPVVTISSDGITHYPAPVTSDSSSAFERFGEPR